VRSTTLFDPVNTGHVVHPEHHTHEGADTMQDSLQLSAVDHLAHDRISDLLTTASETRTDGRRPADDRPGLVTRTRLTLGRRLISIGSVVAGQPH
jgi:hypothetical protein